MQILPGSGGAPGAGGSVNPASGGMVPGGGGMPGGGKVGAGGAPVGGSGVAGMGVAGMGVAGMGVAGMSAGGAGAGGSGAGGMSAAGAGGMIVGSGDPKIPAAPADCPQLKTGTITVLGQNVQLWVGQKQDPKKGAVMFYWHGTGGQSTEASRLGAALTEIQSEGGIVASFSTSLKTGTNTGNNVWYTDDFKMADVILACAVQQLNIDTHRIYTAGCSAGGLQAGSMAYSRSSYLAASMPNSGGVIKFYINKFEDPAHIPSVITAHGGDADMVGIKFADSSNDECTAVKAAGGIAVDCNHGGNHCAAPTDLIAKQWQFLKDHPFGVKPDPYAAGLPMGFPTYCKQY